MRRENHPIPKGRNIICKVKVVIEIDVLVVISNSQQMILVVVTRGLGDHCLKAYKIDNFLSSSEGRFITLDKVVTV